MFMTDRIDPYVPPCVLDRDIHGYNLLVTSQDTKCHQISNLSKGDPYKLDPLFRGIWTYCSGNVDSIVA